MIATTLYAILVASTLVQGGSQTRPDYIVDVVAARAEAPSRNTVSESPDQLRLPERLVAPLPGEAQEPVFDVRVVSLDRQSYAIGDSFVYELLIRNAGRRPVFFPVRVSADGLRKSMPRARVAAVALALNDRALGSHLVGATMLYGAADVPGSLVQLEPGQTVLIRAPAVWVLSARRQAPLTGDWTREADVGGEVQLDCLDEFCAPLVTTETVKVELRRR